MVGVNICSALPPCPWYPRWERWTGRGRGCLSHDGCGIRSVPPAHGTQEGRVGQGEKGQKWGEVQFSAPCPQEPRSGICREQQMLGSRWVECKSVLCFPPAPAQLPESHRGRMLGRRALWPRATPLSDQASEGKKKRPLRGTASRCPARAFSTRERLAGSISPTRPAAMGIGLGAGRSGAGRVGGGQVATWPRRNARARGPGASQERAGTLASGHQARPALANHGEVGGASPGGRGGSASRAGRAGGAGQLADADGGWRPAPR